MTAEFCWLRRRKVLAWLRCNRRLTLLSIRLSKGCACRLNNNFTTMKKRLLSAFILIVYSAILIKVMVFKDMPLIRIGSLRFNFGGTQEGPANLIPFKTILPYLLGEKGFMIAAINLVGNIVLLVPIGLIVPLVFRNITWKKSLAVALAAGFAIEGMQALLHVGIFDIDDVLLNGLGVMVGYWAFKILLKMQRSRKSASRVRQSLVN